MLTTRCPHCQTMFRIRPEQLNMRGGRVRCGSCHQAFSALASLEELPEETPDASGQTQTSETSPPAPNVAVPKQESAPERETHTRPKPVLQAPEAPLVMPSAIPDGRAEHAAPEPEPRTEPRFTAGLAAEVDTQFELPDPPVVALDKTDGDPDLELRWVAIDHHALTNGAVQPSPERIEDFAGERFTLPGDIEEPFIGGLAGRGGSEVPLPAAAPDFIEPPIVEAAKPVPAAQDNKVEPAIAVPYKSKIAEELGIEPYDPSKDQASGFTVLLEDALGSSSGATTLSNYAYEGPAQHRAQPRRMAFLPWIGGSLVLALLAATQAAFVFRTDLARVVPATRPVMEHLCARLGCSVPYPKDADLIQVEGTSLNPEGGAGRFRLTVNLHNKAGYAQSWPHLELTLTDRFDIAIVRRVLKPAEWLPQANAAQPAFPGRDDVTANVTVIADGLPAVGYRLYAFYP